MLLSRPGNRLACILAIMLATVYPSERFCDSPRLAVAETARLELLPDSSTQQDEDAPARNQSLPDGQFVNPIGEGADPWVVRDPQNNRYLWCFSEGNRAIAIHTSDRLTAYGQKHIVWQAPDSGPYSRQVWAPELHRIDDRWYIYMAASDGENANHLAYVLKSQSDDPLGPYQLHGPLATGDGPDGRSPNIWAIDMTVLEHNDVLYALWSGWDAPGTDRQYLYIAPMKSPVELAGPRVRICDNADFAWERTEAGDAGRGLNEAPQVLKRDGRTFVTYSCGASWLPSYKLGMLELEGDDPLDPNSWTKSRQPIFEGNEQTYGVGHSCFITSPDGSQWWHVYHAKRDRRPGWQRVIFVQPMQFGPQGVPQLGQPVAAGVPLPRPSGEKLPAVELPFESLLKPTSDWRPWNYYGHHQFLAFTEAGVEIGGLPNDRVNEYRSGEKLLLDRRLPSDVRAEVTIDFLGDRQARDAGLLFRVSAPSVGYDAQRGYFAGLIPRTGLAIIGKMDGREWQELARAPVDLDPTQPQRLRIETQGPQFTLSVNGEVVLSTRDATYSHGKFGLRVVDTQARFSDLKVTRGP